jgi:hypothetical protein
VNDKIDINKKYKTRSGLSVKIYSVDDDKKRKKRKKYGVYGTFLLNTGLVSFLWDKYGRFNINTGIDHDLDLIEDNK